MKIFRSMGTPVREGLTTQELWFQEDNGLIACWENGQQYATTHQDLAAAARAGELVPLPWKGGIAHSTKAKHKFGPFRYLAMWQGLRGDDLYMDTELETPVTCSRYRITVTFTTEHEKYVDL